MTVRDLYGEAGLGDYLLYAVLDYILVRRRRKLRPEAEDIEERLPERVELVHEEHPRQADHRGVLPGNLACVGRKEHLLALFEEVRQMAVLGIVPFYIVFFAAAAVIERGLAFHHDLSDLADVRAVPALERGKLVFLPAGVPVLEPGLRAGRQLFCLRP